MDFNKDFVLMGRKGFVKKTEDSGYKDFLDPQDEPVNYLTQENREWNRRHRSSTDYSAWMERQGGGI